MGSFSLAVAFHVRVLPGLGSTTRGACWARCKRTELGSVVGGYLHDGVSRCSGEARAPAPPRVLHAVVDTRLPASTVRDMPLAWLHAACLFKHINPDCARLYKPPYIASNCNTTADMSPGNVPRTTG
jgi:hypothetical protein